MAATIEKLIFLTYLTNYHVSTIYQCVQNSSKGSFEELAVLASEKFISAKNTSVKLNEDNLYESIERAKSRAKEAVDRLNYLNIKAISYLDHKYPKSLQMINDRPPVIYLRGELPRNTKQLAAVVGSRDISKNAIRITNMIVDILTQCNYGIVSGLALGIDTLAHERALEDNQYTMAVLPNALDKIYPAENYELAKRIEDKGGSLISELIFGINRGKSSFVQRNRIQSGLSSIVLPVEMGAKSGTMHTVDFAMRQNKNLILLKRNGYSKFSEGIKILIDKYSTSEASNVYIIDGISEFVQYMTRTSGRNNIGIQAKLF